MTHKILIVVLACSSFVLSSCESDLTTSNNSTLEKKLVLNPTRLELQQYDQCTLKARITNLPLMDASFLWDFDEGNGFETAWWMVTHTFYQAKVHFVRVKAFDAFTDEQLGFDSIRVDVRPPSAFVELSPHLVDTLFPIYVTGRASEYTVFRVKTSTPLSLVRIVWDFGDGDSYVDTTAGNSGGYAAHAFPVGTFTVSVKVYEKSGLFLGEDSARVTVGFPKLSMADFSNMRSVIVALRIDSLHPIAQDPLFRNPFAIQLVNDTTVRSEFDASEFELALDKKLEVNTFSHSMAQWHDTIQGTFSNNFEKLNSVNVSVSDSGYTLYPRSTNPGTLRYRFELKDLELLSVYGSTIVYRSKSASLPDFLENVSFSATGNQNYPAGSFYPDFNQIFIPATKPGVVYGLVVFTR